MEPETQERRLWVVPHPTENLLGRGYLLLDAQGLLPAMWHDSNGAPSLSGFLALTKRLDTIFYACFENDRLAGLGWATDMLSLGNGRFRATVGQAFMREFWKADTTCVLAGKCLDHCFKEGKIDVCYGFTPVLNAPAVRFVSKMGFTKLCVAPSYDSWANEPCDCMISSMTRQQWEEQQNGRS